MQASGYADIDIVEAAVSLSLTKSTTLMDRICILWCFSLSTHKVFKIGSTSGLTNQKTTLYSVSYHCSEECVGEGYLKTAHICACLHMV